MAADAIKRRVRQSAEALIASEPFTSWLADEKGLAAGDLICINNSFVFRDTVATKKSAEYLGFNCDPSGKPMKSSLLVASPPSFNSDFKRFSKKSTNVSRQSLDDATAKQLAQCGELVFVLVGKIDDTVGVERELSAEPFKALRFDPTARAHVAVEDGVVTVRDLEDPEALWEAAARESKKKGQDISEKSEAAFALCIEKLQADVYSLLRLPGARVQDTSQTLLGKLGERLGSQCKEYEKSLVACGDDPSRDREAFNNVLRIAYNFSADASRFIELLVSICDIKPIVLWGTLEEHVKLAEAFRRLPWRKSAKKASLGTYQTTIAGARNHAFHNFMPIHRAIEVDVSGVALKATRLRLFSPHSKKTDNMLEYEDQEIVDILTRFTRAPEMAVPISFWRKNLEVMQATRELVNGTLRHLVALRAATQGA